jgi:hypothetical protein
MRKFLKYTVSMAVSVAIFMTNAPIFNYVMAEDVPTFTATSGHIVKLLQAATIDKTPTVYGEQLSDPVEGKVLFGGSKYFVVNCDNASKELTLYCDAPYLYYPFYRANVNSHSNNGANDQNANRYKLSDINAYLTGGENKAPITDANAYYLDGSYGAGGSAGVMTTLKKYDGTNATSLYNDFFKGSREVDWKAALSKTIKTLAYANAADGSGNGTTLVTNPDEVQAKFYLVSAGLGNEAREQSVSVDVNNDISSSNFTPGNPLGIFEISRKYWPKIKSGYFSQHHWSRSASSLLSGNYAVPYYRNSSSSNNEVYMAMLVSPALNLDLSSVVFASTAEAESSETKKFTLGYNYTKNNNKNIILTLDDADGYSVKSSITASDITSRDGKLNFNLSAAPASGEYVAVLLDNGTDTELVELESAQAGANRAVTTISPNSNGKMDAKILVCKNNTTGIYEDAAANSMQDDSLTVNNYKIRYAKAAGEAQFTQTSEPTGSTDFGEPDDSADVTVSNVSADILKTADFAKTGDNSVLRITVIVVLILTSGLIFVITKRKRNI